MIKYICDRCSALMEKEKLRYQVRLEIFAAYDSLEFKEADKRSSQDIRREIEDLIKQMEDMDEQELQDQVHVKFEYDLCQKCRDEIYERHKRGAGIGKE